MFEDPIVKKTGNRNVLVAPLDWGLGHATRCIPVIYELLKQDYNVWLAGEGAQETLLKQEFPKLPFLPLRGYRVKYGGSPAGLLWSVFFQLPRIFKTIRDENNWLKKTVEKYRFDIIISDNRFGLYHSSVPSIFITHQLRIKTSFGKWSEFFLQRLNYRFINRFTQCWIPDEEDKNGLAGELSHPVVMPAIPSYYLGILSRLKKKNIAEKKNHLFISLSGPEPQRTLLENKIIHDIGHYNGTATIVRGLPGTSYLIPSTNDIRFFNHLDTGEYSTEMEKAEYVISRSGYSTVMDIITLGKKSILIPTPGQTEQEWIAKYLIQKQVAFCVNQKDFALEKTLQKASGFEYKQVSGLKNSNLPLLINSLLKGSAGKI
ncbi:MAG: glycosyltransferase [Chitinophagaceae bacterium]